MSIGPRLSRWSPSGLCETHLSLDHAREALFDDDELLHLAATNNIEQVKYLPFPLFIDSSTDEREEQHPDQPPP